MLSIFVAPAFCAPIFAAPAMAQDGDPLVTLNPMNAITVTATRRPTTIGEVPATVSVISARQIADQMAADIKDLIRFEPGVSVHRAPARFGAASGTTGRDGNAGFNIRGLEGNRVLMQVDGVRVPDGFEFGAQAAGRGDYVDLGLVKSVEILRGPASALYGSDGLAGAVSFITSDPEDFLKGGRKIAGLARVAYDSADNKATETGILAGQSGAWSALVAYTRRDGHEQENKGSNYAANSTRTAANPQDTQSNAVLAKLVFTPSAGHRLRLTLDHLDNHTYTNGLSGVAPTASASTSVIGLIGRDTVRRDRVSLDWRWQGAGAIEMAQITGWYQKSDNREYSAEDRYTAADRTRLNTFANRVLGLSAELHSSLNTGALSHALVYGADASFTRQEGVRDGTVPPTNETFPTRAFPPTDFTLAGFYLGDEIAVGDKVLTLYPVLRFDHYKLSPKSDGLTSNFTGQGQSGSRVSPKIGARVKLGLVSLFGNYAQGFKAPAPTQVNQFFENLAFGYTSVPNPNLKPETSETFEGGIRIAQGGISAGITGFTGRYRDFISQQVVSGAFTPSNPAVYQFINLNRVRISGAEGQVMLRAKSGFSGRMAISYARGTVTGTDGAQTPLSTIDPLKLIMGLGYDAPGGRFGGQIIMIHSAQKEMSATNAADCSNSLCYRPGAFTILDATAYVRLGQALTLRAGVFNLTNAKYAWWSDVRGLSASSSVTDAYTQPGRNASVSLTARF